MAFLSTQLTLKLHGAMGYSSLPYILHCGGLRDALARGQLERKVDPKTGSTRLSFKGYNDKNSYDRHTPCDHDFVRKLARDTTPLDLEAWYANDVARCFAEADAYDSEGIFMLDGSYLFVPDNDHYEDSKVAYFDKHNHPVSKEEREKLPPREQRNVRLRRYYQTVALSHTNRRRDYLLYAAGKMLRTEGHEVLAFLPTVEQFVRAAGPGVMKILLVDRGFIDGKSISGVKALGVDVVIPLKGGMNITEDAWKLAEVDQSAWKVWTPPPPPPPFDPPQRPEHIRRAEKKRQETVRKNKEAAGIEPPRTALRVELKLIPGMKHWEECSVPMDVVLMREHMSDGEISQWGLMTTRRVSDPVEIWELYKLRVSCEEGWRQTKCYWDLSGFRSCNFALITSQVIFVLMAYSLLQIFLLKSDRGEFTNMTRQRLLAELLPDGEKVAVYWGNRVGYFGISEYSSILLALEEGARRRLQGTVRRLQKSRFEPPALPKRPT